MFMSDRVLRVQPSPQQCSWVFVAKLLGVLLLTKITEDEVILHKRQL